VDEKNYRSRQTRGFHPDRLKYVPAGAREPALFLDSQTEALLIACVDRVTVGGRASIPLFDRPARLFLGNSRHRHGSGEPPFMRRRFPSES